MMRNNNILKKKRIETINTDEFIMKLISKEKRERLIIYGIKMK